MSDVNTVKNIVEAAADSGLDADPNTVGFTMGFIAASHATSTVAASNGAGGEVNQYLGKEDGWWTKWNGPDVSLTLDQKVERAASIAEEITKDYVRCWWWCAGAAVARAQRAQRWLGAGKRG
jgi:hypothetical protein